MYISSQMKIAAEVFCMHVLDISKKYKKEFYFDMQHL